MYPTRPDDPRTNSRTDPLTDPPTDWQIVRGWLIRVSRRYRTPLLLAANVAAIVIALLVYHALTPSPYRLTQRDIDAAVDHSLQTSPPAPSVASVAYDIIRPSLVVIEAHLPGADKGSASVGTGVVIVDTGIIMTCLHVVQDASQVTVIFADGSESEALVMVREPEKDLAVLSAMRIPDDLKPATLASSSSLRVGDEVVAVGTPFGIPGSVTSGVVSGLGRDYESRQTGVTLKNLIQFDAAVNPGNSGGPLVNRNGEVVGIVAALLNPTNQDVFIGIGFAVPIDEAGSAIGFPPV